MQRRKLNFRFHNPGTVEATADYILKIFIEANMSKVEKAIREAAEQGWGEDARGAELRTASCSSEPSSRQTSLVP